MLSEVAKEDHGECEEYENYFERQQRKVSQMHICDDTLYEVRKKEYIHKKLLLEKLQAFQSDNN